MKIELRNSLKILVHNFHEFDLTQTIKLIINCIHIVK